MATTSVFAITRGTSWRGASRAGARARSAGCVDWPIAPVLIDSSPDPTVSCATPSRRVTTSRTPDGGSCVRLLELQHLEVDRRDDQQQHQAERGDCRALADVPEAKGVLVRQHGQDL